MTPLDDLIAGAHAVLIGGSTAMHWIPPADGWCPQHHMRASDPNHPAHQMEEAAA